jgi:hypothetical protein
VSTQAGHNVATHISAFRLHACKTNSSSGRNAILQLQRLESESRSHIQTQFTETWHGLATVRAYNQEASFTSTFAHAVDRNGGAMFGMQDRYRQMMIIMPG